MDVSCYTNFRFISIAGDDSLDDFSSPLMDMGLDSLAAVEFRNRVQATPKMECEAKSVAVNDVNF